MEVASLFVFRQVFRSLGILRGIFYGRLRDWTSGGATHTSECKNVEGYSATGGSNMAAVQVKYRPVGVLSVLILLSTLVVISMKSRKRTRALTKDLQPTRGTPKTVPDCLGYCACLKFTDPGCTEKIDLIFIRTERTGSDVLASMFHRFGHERKLEFVLPRGGEDDLYLGWPGPVELRHYRPRHTRHFNLLVERTVYDKQALRHLFPHGASYVTVLREPWAQFKSAFHYYGVDTVVGIQGDDPIAEFLQRPQYYDDVYRSSEARSRRSEVPGGVLVTHNPMARDLGISEQSWHNVTAINEQIKVCESKITTSICDNIICNSKSQSSWVLDHLLIQLYNLHGP
ncbi:uncharacterized protein LOC118424488 [Branchiostoma floridae]|uniref:Uncharacterized protein LOC118424488 n=1 Tax=Branchiostoma floridae TaxID=7739 RepID=A0A9J7N458_BRAFL|nr:uncharacterized protein LOC118424488 [Branchiostoma floridae]